MFKSFGDLPHIETKIRAQTITNKRITAFFSEMFSHFPVDVITDSGNKQEIALKLKRLAKISDVINGVVCEKLGKFNKITDDWNKQLDAVLQREKRSNYCRDKKNLDYRSLLFLNDKKISP